MGTERPVEEARTGCHGCRAASLRVTQLRIRIFGMSRDVACCLVLDMLLLVPRMSVGVKKKKRGWPPPGSVSGEEKRPKKEEKLPPPGSISGEEKRKGRTLPTPGSISGEEGAKKKIEMS